VWCYSQKQDWWRGDLIPGSGAGIRRARARLQALEPLGFDLAAGWGEGSVMKLPRVDLKVRSTPDPAIVARVTGSDISRVDFYRSGELLRRDEQSPYRLNLEVLPPGQATFAVRVFDAHGAHGTSAPVRIKVP
jgi:hypothetical protein